MTFSLSNTTRLPVPKLPFEAVTRHVLGRDYELSLVFCGDALSRRLNRIYRGKDYPTNVLSFSLSKNSGEIFVNLRRLKGFDPAALVVHGLFHLKGLRHGRRMDTAEARVRALFHVSYYRGRDRHRHLGGQSRHR